MSDCLTFSFDLLSIVAYGIGILKEFAVSIDEFNSK